MAVEDDLRSLSEVRGNIYLGWALGGVGPVAEGAFTVWHEGKLQQANDGNWIFRSSSSDGSIVAFQLGFPRQEPPTTAWQSVGSAREGIVVRFPCMEWPGGGGGAPQPVGSVQLRQQLPQNVTN